jgi:heterodisulfide reductase subunit A-like polyferredoxin
MSMPVGQTSSRTTRRTGLTASVAACSPCMHEPTFAMFASRREPYQLHAHIREQCSWVHKDGATEKAKALVSAAISRA